MYEERYSLISINHKVLAKKISSMNNLWQSALVDRENLTLILLSIPIAFTACYTALKIQNKVNEDQWLASMALGLGIWVTDLFGFLGNRQSVVSQSPWLMVLSLVVAIAASGLVLSLKSKDLGRSPIELLKQGIFWAGAIAVPHYLILADSVTIGDADLLITCNLWLLLLGSILTSGLSALALYFWDETIALTSAGLLGAAILGEKSIAIAAIQVLPYEGFSNGPLLKLTLETSWAIEQSSVIWAIAIATVIIISLMLWTLNLENSGEHSSKSPRVPYESPTVKNLPSKASSLETPQELDHYNSRSRDSEAAPTMTATNDRDNDQDRHQDAALIASQARLAGIVDIADDAIITVDEQQRITLFNKGAEKIFGYTATEVLGQSLDLLLPQNARKSHQHHVKEFGHSGDQSRKMGDRRAIFGRRRDGSEFPAEASISQLVLGEEKIFTVILRDISDRIDNETALRQAYEQLETRIEERTAELAYANVTLQAEIAERQQTEATLRSSQHRYQTLANVAPVGIFHTNADGKCLYVNDRWCEITGMTPDEALGDGWVNAIHPDDRQEVFTEWDRAAKANQLFKYEYRFLRPDGLEPWVLGWAGADRDRNGQLLGYVGTITDIGDRKRIEKQLRQSRQELERRVQQRTTELAKATFALRESQSRLDGILASLDDLVWSVSTETFQFVYLSPAVERIYGRPAADFLQNSQLWLELIHPEDQQRASKLSAEFLETGTKDIEYRILRPDGEVRWIRDRARLLYDDEGKSIRMDGIATDITDRKQMQETLLESEERFRKIFTQGPVGMAVVGLDDRFIQVNERLCEMVGYPEHELMSLTFLEITHVDDIELDTALAQQLSQGEIPYYTLEKRYLKKDREIVWINLTACLIRDEEKQPLYFISIIEDISDRKQYESRLEKERQQLQQIITNAPVAMVMCDRQLVVFAHSNKWLNDYNLQGQSIIGQQLNQILPDMPKHWQELHHRGLQGEIINTPEELFQRQDGSKLYLRLAVNPWYTADAKVGGIVMATSRIDQLVQSREVALETVRMKSEFLANMSHEIRTPMNGVLGMAGLLEQTELNADQRDFVQTILSSAENLLNIINDILDFSKLEAGQMELESLDFNLKQCIEEVIDLLATPAYNKGLELASWVSRDLPIQLQGDPGRLRQILMNLVGNAIKFTESGEAIVQAFLESENETDVVVMFCIKDTGIGIPPEKQKKLFQSFSQVDASITREYGGTGLGLAICQQLVQLMDGEIGVFSLGDFYPCLPKRFEQIPLRNSLEESCEQYLVNVPQFCNEKGSTFWFTARFKKSLNPSAEIIDKIPDDALRSLRLLVVDDNATNRKILRYQAQDWGMQVDEAVSGNEALKALQISLENQQLYDAAILDMQMPEMDGETLGKIIHSNPNYADIKLIMMTSINLPHAKNRLEKTFCKFLVKPVKESRLRECFKLLFPYVLNSGDFQSKLDVKKDQNLAICETVSSSRDRSQSKFVALAEPESEEASNKTNEVQDNLSQKILIVEDNAINQKVVRHQLKRLGYKHITIAANGQEALDLLESIHYDLVLMDCQMPILDGYRATELLRQREGSRQHTVIIAMTANAMKGDREKCLNAGMDDYLTKPLDVDRLAATFKRWSELPQMHSTTEKKDCQTMKDFINLERFEEISGGDLEFQQELLQEYLEDMKTWEERLSEAMAAEDFVAIKNQAHTIKGASSNIGAYLIEETAANLEQKAERSDSFSLVVSLVDELKIRFATIKNFKISS